LVKRSEAKQILEALGMPPAQQNPNAQYTLLAFTGIRPGACWSDAAEPRLTPHDVIAFAHEAYGKLYAENTRETIRRQAIHQFVQGGILIRNPDDPTLPTNSPLTHYAMTAEALDVVRAFGTPEFSAAAERFRLARAGGGSPSAMVGRAAPLPSPCQSPAARHWSFRPAHTTCFRRRSSILFCRASRLIAACFI
jgi:hypothetical protein